MTGPDKNNLFDILSAAGKILADKAVDDFTSADLLALASPGELVEAGLNSDGTPIEPLIEDEDLIEFEFSLTLRDLRPVVRAANKQEAVEKLLKMSIEEVGATSGNYKIMRP